jgi:hypothetical protein
MELIRWLLRIAIPFVVLYSIGYFVPGFSALTIGWLLALSILIALGFWLAVKVMGKELHQWGRMVTMFLVATAVIFLATLAIEGGGVPLGGSLLAAILIALLGNLVPEKPGTLFKQVNR